MNRSLKGVAAATLALLGLASVAPPAAHASINVNLELALLVDVSGSISSTEFALQRGAYANAFQDAGIQSAIASLPGGIAVTLVYWSGAGQVSQAINWTQVTNAAQANTLAAAILATSRPYSGSTAPGDAISAITQNAFLPAITTFDENNFVSDRQVIDVSGDGVQNAGVNTSTASNTAIALGIDQINGLVIGTDPAVLTFYNNSIKRGAGSFVVQANNFDQFESTLIQKIGREINPVPEPSTLITGLLGVAGATLILRRRGSVDAKSA